MADAADIIRALASKAGLGVAAEYEGSLAALYDRLAIFPESGAPRPQLGRNLRLGLVSPYVAVYRYAPTANLVEILRVLHGSRQISRNLLKVK